jgi:adenylate cyclase
MSLGQSGFREHFDEALATARPVDAPVYASTVMLKYLGIPLGVSLPDDTALRETADALALAERSGDPLTLGNALLARGITLLHQEGPDCDAGYDLLAKARAMALAHQVPILWAQVADIHTAIRKARRADTDGSIELAHTALDNMVASGDLVFRGWATSALVESLLSRGTDGDIAEAQAAIDRLATVPTDPGYVMHELPLLRLRTLLARARSNDDDYRDLRDRYRKMATDLGFEGHMQWAEAMP